MIRLKRGGGARLAEGVWPQPAACVAAVALCASRGVNDSFVRRAASPHLKDGHEGEINWSLRK